MPVLLSLLSGQAVKGMAGEGRRAPWYQRDGGVSAAQVLGHGSEGQGIRAPRECRGTGLGLLGGESPT